MAPSSNWEWIRGGGGNGQVAWHGGTIWFSSDCTTQEVFGCDSALYNTSWLIVWLKRTKSARTCGSSGGRLKKKKTEEGGRRRGYDPKQNEENHLSALIVLRGWATVVLSTPSSQIHFQPFINLIKRWDKLDYLLISSYLLFQVLPPCNDPPPAVHPPLPTHSLTSSLM